MPTAPPPAKQPVDRRRPRPGVQQPCRSQRRELTRGRRWPVHRRGSAEDAVQLTAVRIRRVEERVLTGHGQELEIGRLLHARSRGRTVACRSDPVGRGTACRTRSPPRDTHCRSRARPPAARTRRPSPRCNRSSGCRRAPGSVKGVAQRAELGRGPDPPGTASRSARRRRHRRPLPTCPAPTSLMRNFAPGPSVEPEPERVAEPVGPDLAAHLGLPGGPHEVLHAIVPFGFAGDRSSRRG